MVTFVKMLRLARVNYKRSNLAYVGALNVIMPEYSFAAFTMKKRQAITLQKVPF